MKISDIEKVLLEQQDELEALESEVLIHRPEEDLINLNSKLAQVVIVSEEVVSPLSASTHLEKLVYTMPMPILTMNVWRNWGRKILTMFFRRYIRYMVSLTICFWMKSRISTDGLCL